MYRTTSLLALGLFLGLAPVGAQAQTQTQEPAQQQMKQQPAQQGTQQQGTEQADEQEQRVMLQDEDSLLVSSVMGASVYSQDNEEIGDISDMIVGLDGNVEGVVIGVGGFLGMGEKDVAMEMNSLSVATTDDGDVRLFLNASKEELEAAPEFRSAADQQDDTGYGTDSQQGMRTDQDTTAQAPTQQTLSAEKEDKAEIDSTAQQDTAVQQPQGQQQAEQAEQAEQQAEQAEQQAQQAQRQAEQAEQQAEQAQKDTAEQDEEAEGRPVQGQIVLQDENSVLASTMIGSTVYSANEEGIGDISDIIVQIDGKVEGVVIGVGGFLGIGEKNVSIAMDRFQVQQGEAGEEPRLVLSSTKEELQGAPEFKQPQ